MPKPKRQKKIKTGIYIEEELMKALQQIADRTLIPKSSLIRLGIKKIVEEYSKKLR